MRSAGQRMHPARLLPASADPLAARLSENCTPYSKYRGAGAHLREVKDAPWAALSLVSLLAFCLHEIPQRKAQLLAPCRGRRHRTSRKFPCLCPPYPFSSGHPQIHLLSHDVLKSLVCWDPIISRPSFCGSLKLTRDAALCLLSSPDLRSAVVREVPPPWYILGEETDTADEKGGESFRHHSVET